MQKYSDTCTYIVFNWKFGVLESTLDVFTTIIFLCQFLLFVDMMVVYPMPHTVKILKNLQNCQDFIPFCLIVYILRSEETFARTKRWRLAFQIKQDDAIRYIYILYLCNLCVPSRSIPEINVDDGILPIFISRWEVPKFVSCSKKKVS